MAAPLQVAAVAKSIHRAEYDLVRDLLREKRVGSGLTQLDVSQRMRRSQSFVSDVERGVRRIDVLELRDLCELYGIQLTAFCREFERRAAAAPPSATRSGEQRTPGAAGTSNAHSRTPPRARSTHRPSRK